MMRVPRNCARPTRRGQHCAAPREAVRKSARAGGRRPGERARNFEIARHLNNWASHFVGLELRPGAEAPPPLLPNLSYAAANRRSRRATYLTVCSKRDTLLGNAIGLTVCAGTERDNGMLGGQLFGPGGDYHSRILDRWAANSGRREGAMVDPERRPLIVLRLAALKPQRTGFQGTKCTSI